MEIRRVKIIAIITLTILSIFSFSYNSMARVILVPRDYSTIQEAIDNSSDFDTVMVNPGTYLENIDFAGKKITVKSVGGPDNVTINGRNSICVVRFVNGEGADSKLLGFTLTQGGGFRKDAGTHGGGVYCGETPGACPVIKNNIIRGNWAGYGGGICCDDECHPTIENNTIIDNDATLTSFGKIGGGICLLDKCNPVIVNNIIGDNRASYGGGIACTEKSKPTISSNVIGSMEFRNYAEIDGGGIYCLDSSPILYPLNTISYNTAERHGGGIHMERADSDIYYKIEISSNTIEYNSAGSMSQNGFGGGIYCLNIVAEEGDISRISSNFIRFNQCYGDGIYFGGGGGICCNTMGSVSTPSVIIEENRIVSNVSNNGRGGGVHCEIACAITRCNYISSNEADVAGGGISYYGMDNQFNEIVTNLIYNNKVRSTNDTIGGGGIYVDYSMDTVISYNTIVYNIVEDSLSSGKGGGIFGQHGEMRNSIIYYNEAYTDSQIYVTPFGNLDVEYCDIEGGYPTGSGNISDDPGFVQDDLQFHLSSNSDCIDAGLNGEPPDPDKDFEQDWRIIDGDNNQIPDVDMGWDEYSG